MTDGKTIKQAIRRKFPHIDIDNNLESALKIMTETNVSVLAVKIGEEIAGLVTVSDVMSSLANEDDIKETKISRFMTQCEFDISKETRNPCIQLDEDEDALFAIKVMHEAGVHHLLISGTGGKVVGIVSALELVKLFGPSIDTGNE